MDVKHDRACTVADLTALAPDLLNIIGTVLVVLDVDGNVVYVNDHALTVIGRSKDEVMCHNWIDLVVDPKDKAVVDDVFKKLITGKNITDVEYFENVIYSKDGEPKQIIWHSEILKDPVTKKNVYLMSSGNEITELRQTEESLRKKDEALKRTLLFSAELLETKIVNSDYKKFTDATIDISGADYAVFNLFEENGKEFTTVSISGINENVIKATKLLGFDILNKKWGYDPAREKKIKDKKINEFSTLHDLTGDVVPHNITDIIHKTFKLGPVVVVNILREGVAIGDFTLIFREGKEIQNREIVELFADQVSLILYKMRAESHLEAKISELQKVNEQMTGRELKMIELKKEIERLNSGK